MGGINVVAPVKACQEAVAAQAPGCAVEQAVCCGATAKALCTPTRSLPALGRPPVAGPRHAPGPVGGPYHGWQFAAGGQCTHDARTASFVPRPPCARHFEAQRLMAWSGCASHRASRDLPAFAAEGDARLRKLSAAVRDVAASAPASSRIFWTCRISALCTKAGWAAEKRRPSTTTAWRRPRACWPRAARPGNRSPTTCIQRRAAQVEYTYEVTAPVSQPC